MATIDPTRTKAYQLKMYTMHLETITALNPSLANYPYYLQNNLRNIELTKEFIKLIPTIYKD